MFPLAKVKAEENEKEEDVNEKHIHTECEVNSVIAHTDGGTSDGCVRCMLTFHVHVCVSSSSHRL